MTAEGGQRQVSSIRAACALEVTRDLRAKRSSEELLALHVELSRLGQKFGFGHFREHATREPRELSAEVMLPFAGGHEP